GDGPGPRTRALARPPVGPVHPRLRGGGRRHLHSRSCRGVQLRAHPRQCRRAVVRGIGLEGARGARDRAPGILTHPRISPAQGRPAHTLGRMRGPSERVYVARLAGTTVFDPLGDAVGRVRDVVLLMRSTSAPTAVGLVVEVPGRRRVFMPLTRVTSIAAGQVICTGVINLRRFQARTSETLAIAELLERQVTIKEGRIKAIIEDIAIEPRRDKTWVVTKLYVRKAERRRGVLGFSRRGEGVVVGVDGVTGLMRRGRGQGAALVIQSFADHKPADLAAALMEMSPSRSAEIAAALDDERLADVLEELPEEDQIALLSTLKSDRAADVLEAMEPDDAADLLGDLPAGQAAELLELMEPEDARNVRQLLGCEDDTAGGLMTTEPVIVGPEATA